MVATAVRYRIITSFLIVAETAIVVAIVPQLVALGHLLQRIVQLGLGQ